MTRRLLLSYLAVTWFVLAVLEIPLGVTFASRERNELYADIERDARVLATVFEDVLERDAGAMPVDQATSYTARAGGRVVVVDTTGTSVVDTMASAGSGRDFSTRPEIVTALSGALARGARDSTTLGSRLMYVAVPVASGGQVYGAVRISHTTEALNDRIRDNWIRLGLLSLVVSGGVLAVGWVLARSVTRPVLDLERAAARVAGGDLSARVEADGPPELRALASAFNEMTEQIGRAMHRETSFSADASHQLRTPLTALRLRLESLEDAVDQGGSADLDAALRETERLSEIVTALLALARSTEGGVPVGEVDLSVLAHERVEVWMPLADERDVRLEVAAPPAARALAVRGSVEQILDNLLSNALEVAPPGSSVHVLVSAGSGAATIAVRDEGPGMSDDDLARVFDRFWTTTGTGLGLAIVRRLAEASRGSVEVRRPDAGGLEVGVRLRPARPG
jgi:signal transduction histidine kinase